MNDVDTAAAFILGVNEDVVRSRKWYRGHCHIRYAFAETLNERERIFRRSLHERDSGVCQLCGDSVSFSEMDADHIIPKSKGGSDDWSNMQTSHFSCNRRKGDKIQSGLIPRKIVPTYRLPARRTWAKDKQLEDSAEARVSEMLDIVPLSFKGLLRNMIAERYARFRREIENGGTGINSVMNWQETL